MKRLLIGGMIVLSQTSFANDWSSVTTPEGLTSAATQNFELGVLASGALLCNYYDLYGQLSALPSDIIMFERGKAALVRETKRLTPEDCKLVLKSISAVISQ